MGDVRKRIEGAFNKVEELAKELPGYKGYKQREVRREADKLLRLRAAREIEVQIKKLYQVEAQLADASRLRALLILDRPLMRMQLLVDRLKTASYGYAGLFDAIKVQEAELDALYAFDAALLDEAGRIKALIDAVGAAKDDAGITEAGATLLAAVDELNDTFSRRQDVILEIPSI
jgi:hypothetical protein